jgi:hypothetical protein
MKTLLTSTFALALLAAGCASSEQSTAVPASTPAPTQAAAVAPASAARDVATDYASGPAHLRAAFASVGTSLTDAQLALTVPAAQTTCDTITGSDHAGKAYEASVILAQTKFQTEATARWFVDQSIYAFCPDMASLAQSARGW